MEDEHSEKANNKPFLVLDLDETLVCTTRLKTNSPCDVICVGKQKIFLQKRPGLAEFIEKISMLFHIIIFTSAKNEYADKIINIIAPFVSKENRFYNKSITNYKGFYVKDLKKLKVPLDKTILVDDNPSSGIFQPYNQIIISPWDESSTDDTVIKEELLPLLSNVANRSNLSKAIRDEIESGKYKNLTHWSILRKI